MGRIYDHTWGRIFAAGYDRALKASEDGGLRTMRAELLAGATGRVLEIGAGTGANLGLYPDSVGELVLVEPSPFMARQMRERLGGEQAQVPTPPGSARPAGVRSAANDPPATIAEVPAEALPFPADSFDTAVATLVLCTVPDPAAALAEIGRVLKPGGRLLFVEHVRAESAGLAALAGPPRTPLALPRRRLPLQPRHGGDAGGDRGLRGRVDRARPAAEGDAAAATADPRQRHRPLTRPQTVVEICPL